MMKSKLISFSILSLLLATSCGGKTETKEDTADEKKPLVKVETVDFRPVVQEGHYTATVEPELINNISAASPNRIKQILVDEGIRVSKGQKLVVMDDVNTTSYELQVANAKANLENVQLNYDRAVASAERSLRNVQENTVLVSPIDGIVTARNYDPGDMTGALPIVTVAQVQPVKIVINVSESELSKVKKGMPADVTFDTYGDELFNGTITMVAPTVDADSRTFGVEITMKNPEGRILPGMFGRVQLNLGEAEHVVVADRAVVKQPGSGNHYVYVLNSDGTVSYNKVELGQRLGNTYELLSGVEPGSKVVVSGQSKLANGMAVDVAK